MTRQAGDDLADVGIGRARVHDRDAQHAAAGEVGGGDPPLARPVVGFAELTVERVEPGHVEAVTNALASCGFRIESSARSITVSSNGQTSPLELVTDPYPGFPTDMQAQMCALLSTNDGISVITENIFPQRYMHIAELKRMGAQMQLEGATAVIQGVDRLFGAPVMASDLRASAALVLAGLKAEGVTEVSRVYHIDRGYERLDEKLSELGAHIERVKGT